MTLGVKTVDFHCIIIHVIFDVSLHVYHGAAQPTTESDQMELAMAAIWRCNCEFVRVDLEWKGIIAAARC